MRKRKLQPKRLAVTVEKIRDLNTLKPEQLAAVAGGNITDGVCSKPTNEC